MKFLRRLKIFHRILLAFIVILLMFVGLSFYVTNQVKAIGDLAHIIYRHPLIVSNAALEASCGVTKIHRAMKDLVLADNKSEEEEALSEVNTQQKLVYRQLDLIQSRILGDEGKQLVLTTRKDFDNWIPIRAQVIKLKNEGNINEAELITRGKGYDHVKMLDAEMMKINRYAHNKANIFHRNTEEKETEIITTIIVAIIITIFFSLALISMVALSITKEIAPLRKAMIDSSTFNDLKPIEYNEHNEIADMIASYNTLINRLRVENWYQEGVSKLSTLLLNEKETVKIAEVALKFICEYSKFDFGLICNYFDDEEDCKHLSLYGLEGNKCLFKNNNEECKVISVAKTKKKLLLDKNDVLDKAKEKNITPLNYYFEPVIFENILIGVMVLGAENTFTEEKNVFIDKLNAILTSSLFSSLNKERLLSLSTELQVKEEELLQQNEELQAKEEELLQQNEELISAFEQVSFSEDKYKRLFDNMNECAIIYKLIYDENGKLFDLEYLDVNPYFEKTTFVKKENLIGHTLKQVFKCTDIPNVTDIEILNKTGQPFSREVYFYPLAIDLEVSVFPLKKDEIVMIFTDITTRKKAEAEMIRINNELQNANMHKNKFIATMSHELRTPLNAILGFSESLLMEYFGDLNEKQQEYVSLINNSGQHLLLLINDILDISKIDSGTIDLFIEKINVSELFVNLKSLIKSQCEEKNIALTCNIDDSIDIIYADKQKIKQIMINLLSNAIKFSNLNGSIDIKVVKYRDSHIKFSVSDTGVGIKNSDFENIFTEFYQSDLTRDKALGGSGIGLALCKKFVEMHGGEIFVNSIVDKGSEFYFILPIQKEV
ncbi:MAG: ATP-binding protein [Vampirovibrionia bacterium]